MKTRTAAALLALTLLPVALSTQFCAQDAADGSRKALTKVVPDYPQMLRSMRIQGTVRADVVVAPDGKVKSVEVTGGHPLLAQAAEKALREWKWTPASHESHETVELIFKP